MVSKTYITFIILIVLLILAFGSDVTGRPLVINSGSIIGVILALVVGYIVSKFFDRGLK